MNIKKVFYLNFFISGRAGSNCQPFSPKENALPIALPPITRNRCRIEGLNPKPILYKRIAPPIKLIRILDDFRLELKFQFCKNRVLTFELIIFIIIILENIKKLIIL